MTTPHRRALNVLLLIGAAVVTAPAAPAATAATAATRPVQAANPAARLRALFDREWQWRLREYPEFATAVGDHDFDDRLTDVSLAAQERRSQETLGFLAELQGVDRASLGDDDQVDYDLFETQLRERVDSVRFLDHLMPINADSGFHSSFAQLPQSTPTRTVGDYERYIARLAAFPRLVEQQIAAMREGLRRGMTVPKVTLAGVEHTVDVHFVDDATQSPLWAPFARMPKLFPEAERARLEGLGKRAILESVVPGYRRFHEFLLREYLPGCRDSLAATALPNGREYYRFLIRQFTTLDLEPAAIHRIGLEQVQAIRAEMDAVIRQVGFQGSFAEFLHFLRTDPRFYAKSADELLREASWIAKRMDGKLGSLIKTLPRKPYTVTPVPAHLAPKYTAGRAAGSPKDSPEPGQFWVNTYALETRPLYNLEALTFHEAAPGHLIQGALAEEQEGLPNFRRFSYISAYGEGWGLYSEWLGLEAGFYTDPYANFGRLTYAMWRACRLVVDTGVHAFGWTRQQVLDYLAQNTALSLHEVETETDRYISWPGQALSYKLGEMKIRELRRRAEATLGERFDVREFHDAILGLGSVPLPVLERQIDRFIAAAAQSNRGAPASH
jgi:uncharacterized protein (DUF885 family)